MSNIRLIIFVKIPGQVEPIPLDVIDSRPTQLVLEDILIIIGLKPQEKIGENYQLSLNGTELDLDLRLSENGVKNGSILNISILTDQAQSPEAHIHNKINQLPEQHYVIEDNPKGTKKTHKNNAGQNLPGKIIDFD